MIILDAWKIYIQTTKRTNMLNNTLTDPSNIVEQKKTPNLYLGKKNPNPKQNETSVSLLLYSKYHDFFFDSLYQRNQYYQRQENGQWYKTQMGLLKLYHIRVIK